jgi:RalA-binding protein 1
MGESPVPSPRPGATFGAQTSTTKLGQVSEHTASDTESDDEDGDGELEDPRVDEQFEVFLTPGPPAPNGATDTHPEAGAFALAQSTSTVTNDKSHHSSASTATYKPEEFVHNSHKHEKDQLISFHALPLLSTDLPHTSISVLTSFVRPNDRGKDVLTFTIVVNPGSEKRPWKVEKLYSDVIGLDQRVRANIDRKIAKKVPTLPDGRIWRDHAPVKADQRKVTLCLRT